jgi:hypothetical protein
MSGDAYKIDPNVGLWEGMAWIYKLGASSDQNPTSPIEAKISRQGIRWMAEGGPQGMKTQVHYGWNEVFWNQEMLLPFTVKEFEEKYVKKQALTDEIAKFKIISNIQDPNEVCVVIRAMIASS